MNIKARKLTMRGYTLLYITYKGKNMPQTLFVDISNLLLIQITTHLDLCNWDMLCDNGWLKLSFHTPDTTYPDQSLLHLLYL